MAKGAKTRYSIELDFTTDKAEQSVRAATDKIKERLNSIATEVNKTKYFEGLISDIRDVDEQLTQLKEKHGTDFESIYQGIGKGTRQEFESVFAYARSETEKFYAEVKAKQVELSGLQQIQKDYKKYSKSAVQAMNDENISGFGKSMDVSQVQDMYSSFDKLLEKKAEFEKVGDTASKEYLENYVQILKTASGLIKADAEVANDDKDFGIDVEDLYNMAEKAKSVLKNLDINGFANKITDATNVIKENIQEQINLFAKDMPNRIKSAFEIIDSPSFDEETGQYSELKKKLQEYYELRLKLQSAEKDSPEWDNINNRQRAIQDEIYAIKELSEEQETAFYDLFDSVDDNENLQLTEAITQLCNILKIDIPNGSEQAASATVSAFNTIDESLNQSQKRVNNLLQSLQNVYTSATDLELKVGRGEAESKETMSLIGSDGSISNAIGTDKHLDTDTIVSQLIANLKENIVMSLHNHANGNDMFSPQDLESFANLYYSQGTKINGIIVDGMVKTIDFSGISQELAIKIAQSYTNGIQNIVNKNSNLLTYNNGKIDYTDFVKNLQVTNPEIYKEIVLGVQNDINDALNNAFIQNGVEPTIKQFEYAQLPELVQQLIDIQQNAQNALDPIEKLKNLITTLNPGQTFDWGQFTDIFDKFKSNAIDGTQALNQILNFKTIAADTEVASASIDRASTKVQEFLTLVDEIHNKQFNDAFDATDNVEIGKYTERLNVAKAALDELGNQGQLTAEQLDQVNNAFDAATRDLNAKTHGYDGYAGDSYSTYDYYDEYERAQDKANELERENESLREQLSKQQQNTEQNISSNITSELAQLENLRGKVVKVQAAIDAKTNAFEEEYVTVDAVIDAEIQSLQLLSNKLQEVLQQINLIGESFTKANSEIAELNGVKDIDVNENITSEATAEKANEIMSQNYALDTTLVETNGILNQILIAIGNKESFSQLIDPLNAAVAELKNVANGIVTHQQAQKTNLSDASSRIANQYGQLSSVATMAVSNIGSDIEIKGMKALADNVVRVEGAVRDASGTWNGFIVDINEANQASIVTTNTQSELAKSLNKAAESAKQAGASTKNATDNNFTQSLNNQINTFDNYRENLQDVSYISDDLKTKLNDLSTSLRQVTNTTDLDAWKDTFSEVQKQITLAKDTFTAQQVGKVNQAQKTLEASFKTLDFKTTDSNLTVEQQQLVDGYMQAKAALEAYKKSAQQGNQIELSVIQNVTDALYKQIEAYKQIHNIVNAGGGSKNAYGATAVLNATAKYKSLNQQATSGEFVNSKVVQQMLANYTAAYQRLVSVQSKFKPGESLTNEQITGFKQAQTECNNYAKELNKVITASQKLASGGTDIEFLGGDFEDTIIGRQNALNDFIEATYGASAIIGEFKDNYNQLMFAVDNGDGTFTQMTATINAARNAIVTTAGDTQKATSAFGQFFNELKGKFRTISTYLISSFSLQEVWQQIRQGVNYVREIDSALTELKKVTDETDATYEKFLQTASKTASAIGSTVADFTNATADFARLGYNIEQASKLAEAASVYKNVGDGINDVATASESIISTMKAFGIEAENAMGIVDRFNEVGNNFAISSTGIGEALQRSASALYEAGNTIDESVALVTAANSVINLCHFVTVM